MATGALVWSRPLPAQADRLTWSHGELWVMLAAPNRLFRVDPQSGSTRQTIDLPGGDTDDLAAAGHWLWATVRKPDSVVRIDARTGSRADRFIGQAPTGIAVHGNDLWVSLWASSRIVLLDARTLRPRGPAVDVPLNPFSLVADARGVWVVCAGDGKLVRVKKL
jgi:hypothetical protein